MIMYTLYSTYYMYMYVYIYIHICTYIYIYVSYTFSLMSDITIIDTSLGIGRKGLNSEVVSSAGLISYTFLF